jgi:hypothetical protein
VRVIPDAAWQSVPYAARPSCTAAPNLYVSVEGPITAIEPVDLERDARPLAHRYLGIDAGDAYIAESANAITSGQQIVVRMRPERWLTADYTHKTGESM